MSSSFSFYPQKVRRYKTDAEAVQKRWVSYNDEMSSALGYLASYSGYANVRRRLQEACNNSSQGAASMQRYIKAIEEIIKKYEDTERRICNESDVEEPKWETLIPSEQYTVEELEVDDSWWDQFKEACEEMYTGIPEWLRLLLISNPATANIALTSYIMENDYLRTAFWKAVGGDFEDDTNALGVALSVVIGLIPGLGQAADVRDLVADIYNLTYDDQEPSEWINLGFTVVGILPGLGDFLKHGDEVGDVLQGILGSADAARHIDDIADAASHIDDIADAAGHIDDIAGASRYIDDIAYGATHVGNFISTTVDNIGNFKNAVTQRTIGRVIDPIKDFLKEKLPDQAVNILGRSINDGDTVGDLLKNLSLGEFNNATGIPTDLKSLLKTLFPDSNTKE